MARSDGSIDWIESRLTSNKDLNISKFKGKMDAVILGRKTYEKIVEFKIWPFKTTLPVYVMSSKETLRFPKYIPKNVRHTRECPRHIIRRLEEDDVEQVWVDGMTTISNFLRAGCINYIVINRFPVLLGSGIPLFDMNICNNNNAEEEEDKETNDIQLKLSASVISSFGVVQSQYKVLPNTQKS